jgi:hypothetical protein
MKPPWCTSIHRRPSNNTKNMVGGCSGLGNLNMTQIHKLPSLTHTHMCSKAHAIVAEDYVRTYPWSPSHTKYAKGGFPQENPIEMVVLNNLLLE